MSKEQKDSTENNILFFEFSFDSQICEKLIYEEINCLVTLINKIRSLLSRKDLTEEQKTCAIDDLIHNECINLEIFEVGC